MQVRVDLLFKILVLVGHMLFHVLLMIMIRVDSIVAMNRRRGEGVMLLLMIIVVMLMTCIMLMVA